ncbi:MAG: hypothetical protein OXG15_01420 [Gammaproteobacteria bacterium]|nr:hypothetical protein [Gammaproteobacteria bacterium]
MKTLRKLLAGTVLVTLGLTVFAFWYIPGYDPDNPPVIGFTDAECQNSDWKVFKNFAALKAADGKKDPDAKGDNKDKIWNYYSYINWYDYTYTCWRLEKDVKAIGKTPKKPSTGGGGGGGETPKPPKTQEPKPDPEEEEEEDPSNPANDVSDADIEALKSCWEGKAGNKLKKNGWNPAATTAGTWTIDRLTEFGLGKTEPDTKKVNGKDRLVLNMEIYPTSIGARAVGLIDRFWDWDKEEEGPPPGHYDLAFRHISTFTYIHETYHVSQFLKIFKERGKLPEPWEYWDLEIDAHRESAKMWSAIYKDPPPSRLLKDDEGRAQRAANYEARKTEYLNLEKELADPDTTEERKAVIETKLKKLTKELKNSANLPQAIDNELYSPEDVENFEC